MLCGWYGSKYPPVPITALDISFIARSWKRDAQFKGNVARFRVSSCAHSMPMASSELDMIF